MIFVVNLALYQMVKELLKSVKIWQSSRQSSAANFKGAVFLDHSVNINK